MSVVCLLLALVMPDLPGAQASTPNRAAISGRVTDARGAPLPGVVVTVAGTASETTTDGDGSFRIDGLRPGRHVIRAALSGFAPAEAPVPLAAGETRTVTLTLDEGAYLFERVVVSEEGYAVRRSLTSTRTSSELRHLPQSIQVINKDLTRDQGAVYLNDALRNASGVTMFSEYLDFNFRGFRAQDESVKVDGLNQAHDFFVKPRLLNVERVEVVKGPAGALYGQSKPGGFVNIITKQPSAERSTEVTGRVGSWDKSEGHLSSTGPIPTIGNVFYLVDAARVDNEGFRRHAAAEYTGLSGLVTWAPGPDTAITAGGDWFNDLARGHRNRGIPFYEHQLVDVPRSFTVNEPDDHVEMDATTSRARFNHHISSAWHLDGSVSRLANSSVQRYHEPMGLEPGGRLMRREFRDQYREKQQTALTANVTWAPPAWLGIRHSVLAGTEYTLTNGLLRQGRARDSSLDGPVPDLDIYAPVYGTEATPLRFGYYGPDVDGGIAELSTSTDNRVRAAGVYLQDQAQVGERVHLLGGVRFDHFRDDTRSGSVTSRTGQAVSFRGGAVVAVAPQWSLYGSYADGFEPPPADLSLDPQRYGGPFDPETSWSLEGGVKGFFLRDRVTTTVAVYHITKHDMLLSSPTPELPDRYVPVGAFESRGVELDVAGRVTRALSLYGNYTHSFRAEVTQDVDPANVGKAAENNPRNAANLWARYDLLTRGQWRVGLAGGATYVGRRLTFEVGDVLPSYTKTDAALFVDIGRLGLALNLFNVTDERYFTGGYGGRIGGFLGSVVVFNEEIGWLLTPEVRADPRRGIQSVDAVIASIRERYPGQAVALHLQIGRHWAHTAYVDDLEPGRFLFIDPATGEVRRDDAREGYTWNVSYFLRQLHVRLLMGLWGRVFVGLLGVTLLLSIVTSLWIYREWLRSLLRVRRGAGRRIFHMDLHKAVGLWALAFNVLFAVTGAVLGVENLYYQVWPRSPDQASAETLGGTTRLLDPARSRSPSQVIAALRKLDREFTARVIEIPPPGDPRPLVIRGDHDSPLVAKDTSSYTIEMTSGVLLESVDARRARWDTYLYNTLDPVHFGYFGEGWGLVAGYLVKIVWFVAGLTPGVLTLTGGMMWILRRQRARAAAAARQRLAPGAAGTLVRGDDESAARLSARLAYALGLVVFLAIGYCLQATIWQRGWTLDEVMWQHWMVKPVCLIIVCFPVTAVAVWIGSLTVETRRAPVIGLLGAVPSGLVYLAATAVLN